MKRLLAVWLCILLFPFVYANAETDMSDLSIVSEEVPDPDHRDPNWVLWEDSEDPEDTVEAFADSETPPVLYRGMRPLSRYAQVFTVTDEDLILAARVAYLEAGGRNERAYRAVLCVLFNRCVAPRFGGKVTDIATEAYRKGQFSVIHHKNFKTLEPPAEIVEAARDIFVYGNLDLPESILFFCAARLGRNWGGRRFYQDIGGNLFFYGQVE